MTPLDSDTKVDLRIAPRSVSDSDTTVEIVRFPQEVQRWHLVQEYFRLRREVFVEQMRWKLDTHEDQEFEQYDTLSATYIIASQGGKVVGGARLLRADNRNGIYRYMIHDACAGLLDGLPQELCAGDLSPTDPDCWELTRLVSTGNARIGAEILMKCNAFLKAQGARLCFFLGPPAFMRMAKSMGFTPKPMGPITSNGDGRFLAFRCAVV
ncbi:MAG: acyl-homoserine-lactone synthase [Pseudomonadota bacterium]